MELKASTRSSISSIIVTTDYNGDWWVTTLQGQYSMTVDTSLMEDFLFVEYHTKFTISDPVGFNNGPTARIMTTLAECLMSVFTCRLCGLA